MSVVALTLSRLGWKSEYLKWYRLAEEVLSELVPPLDTNEVYGFISKNNWLIIPAGNEKEKSQSITRSDPNIYFSLRLEGKIRIGLVCNTLESVRRIRNILHGFHTAERENLISELRKLDGTFKTVVQKKIKEHNPLQTPIYKNEFEFPTNIVDDSLLSKTFERIDQILEEGQTMMKMDPKRWRVLAPKLVIAEVFIDRDESKFKEVLSKLKPAYEIALQIKTKEQIDEEAKKRENEKREDKQRRFRDFVESLKKKGVSGEQYREAISRWQRENPD
jgi:hypothetical protein